MTDTLRPVSHPGQSETIVHFTGRARKDAAPETYFLSAKGILDLIVTEERLLAKAPFGSTRRTVCLSESDEGGVSALLSIGQFEGWGLVLRRDWVWRNGGGPIWYARNEVWQAVYSKGDQDLLQWMVRTSPQSSDWLHEREWRIPANADYIDLDWSAVVALLVSDRDWEPHRPTTTDPHPDGGVALIETTNRIASEVPRWFWNGQRIEVLPPLPFKSHIQAVVDL